MTHAFRRIFATAVLSLALIAALAGSSATVFATSIAAPPGATTSTTPAASSGPTPCGDAQHGGPVKVSIDLGCIGKGNPILDMMFGIIHWLSDGVGLVIIGSVIVGGIQYSASRDNPQATAAAVNRLRSALTALLIFIFAYAILNYLIPGAILK